MGSDWLAKLQNYPSVTINPGGIGNGILTIVSRTKVRFENDGYHRLLTVNRVPCTANIELEFRDGSWEVTSIGARKLRLGTATMDDLSDAGRRKLSAYVVAAVSAFMSTDADVFVPRAEAVEKNNRRVWLQHDLDELQTERENLDERIAEKRKELRLLLV